SHAYFAIARLATLQVLRNSIFTIFPYTTLFRSKIKARRLSGDRSFGNTLRYVFRIKATGAFDLSEDGLSKQPVDDRLFSGESIAVTSCSCAKDCAPLARSYSKDHPLRSVHRAGPRLPRPGGPGFFHLLRESRKRNQPVEIGR